MGPSNNYGLALTPNAVIRNLALGWLNSWSYDYHDPLNFTRDTCILVRNNADRLLGEYLKQLGEELSQRRKTFPLPTRENPFPPQEMLDAVRFMELYINEVQSIRTRIIGAPVPPKDFIRHNKNANLKLLTELEVLDKSLIDLLSTITDSTISQLKSALDRRDSLLMSFFSSTVR